VVQLIDPATGREFAMLQAPDGNVSITHLCFSPDGRQLAAATQSHRTHLWDLHQVREKLVAIGLDEGFPADQSVPPGSADRPPVTSVRFIGADSESVRRGQPER
jgi:hypothetical protein